jgi:hypothetical protein
MQCVKFHIDCETADAATIAIASLAATGGSPAGVELIIDCDAIIITMIIITVECKVAH